MPSESVITCCHYLKQEDLTIAFAESASTGRFIYDFTSVPNCGNIIKGSIVCYDRSVKEELFNIPASVIDQHTAESAEVTKLLAERLNSLMPADVRVAITGLASPGGSESEDKPVGTMFVHGYFREKEWSEKFYFEGEPDEIIAKTVEATARKIIKELRG